MRIHVPSSVLASHERPFLSKITHAIYIPNQIAKPIIIFPTLGIWFQIRLIKNTTPRNTNIEPIFASKFSAKKFLIYIAIDLHVHLYRMLILKL